MGYSDLLERMMHRDSDAFLEMTDRYGWSLYNSIRKKYPHKTDADRVYNDTMLQFYSCLQDPSCEDPIEALLCAFAEFVSGKKGFLSDMMTGEQLEEPPAIQIQRLVESQLEFPEKKKRSFLSVISAFALGIVLFLSLWIIVGFLMEQGILPFYDMGYSWFCAMVEDWLYQMNII